MFDELKYIDILIRKLKLQVNKCDPGSIGIEYTNRFLNRRKNVSVTHSGILLALFFFLSFPSLMAQKSKKYFKENFLYGEYYLERQQYTDALPFYQLVYKVDSTNANVNYRIGQCYSNIPEKKQKAIPYLKKATKNIDPNYVAGKYKRPEAPPECWLLLGNVYQHFDKLDSALLAYQEYKKLVEGDKKKVKIADRNINSIDFAKKMNKRHFHMQETNLGGLVNTRFSDYNPVVSGDQSILIFTSFWESYDMIFMSRLENGEWGKPVPINKELNAEGDFYTTAISYKGDELILVQEGNYNSDLYYSKMRNGHWTRMQPLPGKVNSGSQETSASLSKDGKTLYFSSDRPGGEGGMDLYMATLKSGKWEDVKNLGKKINTEFDEEAPCILPDNKTLYFSSNGHETMGGMDIFYSVLDKDGSWSDPVNIGPPINSTGDDLFVDLLNDGKTAYFSKYSPKGYGRNDIFKIKIQEEELAPLASYEETVENNGQQQTITDTSVQAHNDTLKETLLAGEPGNNTLSSEKPAQKEGLTPTGNELEKQVVPYYSADSIYPVNEKPAIAGISGSPNAKFTIQVMALKKFVNVSYFSNLKNIKVSSGDDGFHRYTVGEYSGFRQALRQLDSIRKLGYHEAFVREISTISNY